MVETHVGPLSSVTSSAAMSTLQPQRKRDRLNGRAFYESIGCPSMVLAPMVDQSEFAWRLLTRSYMSPESSKKLVAYTPMLHSRLFTETARFRDRHFQPTKTSLTSHRNTITENSPGGVYLDGNPLHDRPLFVQFCANSPDELLDAAKYVEPYCDAVDLNLGCPQGIAKKGNYGAFLQEDWDLIYRMINKLHTHLDIPVTAKIRILETKEKTLKYAKMILSAGASILTVHGRHRDQKGHRTGLADWKVIRYLRDQLPPETVLFANGNILRHDDLERCLGKTGADAVMSAEGNLCDPTIFARSPEIGEEGREYWRGRDGRGGYRLDAVFRRYMDIIYKYVLEQAPPEREPLFMPSDSLANASSTSLGSVDDESPEEPPSKKQKRDQKQSRSTSPNLIAMQAHLFHLLRPLVTKHTNIRDALAKSRAGDVSAFENVLQLTEAAVKQGLVEYASNPATYEEEKSHQTLTAEEKTEEKTEESVLVDNNNEESSAATILACKRPWWVCQPYVRPLPKEALEKGSLTMSKKDRKKKMIAEEEQAAATLHQKSPDDARRQDTDRQSEREKINHQLDGMAEEDVPKEAMVCG